MTEPLREQCPQCKGKGTYTRILHEGAVGGFDEDAFCFECGGTGEVSKPALREQCRYCGRNEIRMHRVPALLECIDFQECRQFLAERVASLQSLTRERDDWKMRADVYKTNADAADERSDRLRALLGRWLQCGTLEIEERLDLVRETQEAIR